MAGWKINLGSFLYMAGEWGGSVTFFSFLCSSWTLFLGPFYPRGVESKYVFFLFSFFFSPPTSLVQGEWELLSGRILSPFLLTARSNGSNREVSALLFLSFPCAPALASGRRKSGTGRKLL